MAKAKRASNGQFLKRSTGTSIVLASPAPVSRRRRAARTVVRKVRRGVGAAVSEARQRESAMASLAGALALGFAEKPNEQGEPTLKLPTFGGYDPALVTGGVMVLLPYVAKKLVGAKTARLLSDVGVGVASVGVARSVTRGSAKVSGLDYGDDD